MNIFLRRALASGLLLATSAAFADYRLGQKVEFRDDGNNYGGGWVKATITADYGKDAVEEFMVRVDKQKSDDHARFGQIRPADGSPRPPWPTDDPQRRSQLNNYKPLDDGATSAPPARAAPNAATAAAAAPAPAPPAVAAPGTATPGVPAQAGSGMFPNGEPLGTPGQTNTKVGRDGQKHLVAVATPGTQPPFGRWRLKAGGAFTLKDSKDTYDGRRENTYEYSFPADADVVVIKPDGTWIKQFAGKKSEGRWIDLGQSVVQLVKFEDEDWTGSVDKDGQLTLRSPVGLWEYGKRF